MHLIFRCLRNVKNHFNWIFVLKFISIIKDATVTADRETCVRRSHISRNLLCFLNNGWRPIPLLGIQCVPLCIYGDLVGEISW